MTPEARAEAAEPEDGAGTHEREADDHAQDYNPTRRVKEWRPNDDDDAYCRQPGSGPLPPRNSIRRASLHVPALPRTGGSSPAPMFRNDAGAAESWRLHNSFAE